MKICVLACPADTHARELAREIARISGAACSVFDLSLPPGVPVELSRSRLAWDEIDLSAFDRILVLGYEIEDPLVPRPVASADWSLWGIDYLIDQQRASFVASALRDLERRGVSLVNGWHALQFGLTKPRLLADLGRAGHRVPQWLCSNDMPVVQRFCEEQGRVVWRPGAGRALWQRFEDRQRLDLVSPSKPPLLLASVADGSLRRAYVCDGEVLLALDRTAPGIDDFERMEVVSACDAAPIAAELASALHRVGAVWGEISYVEDGGRPCIYDIDPDPRYGWLPAEFRSYLQVRLARKLLGLPLPGQSELPLPSSRERDSLFVRRMLVTLHEMEATKYAKETEGAKDAGSG